jgi:biotin carboxyl carrier protein
MERTFKFGESVCTVQLSGNTSPVKALIGNRKIEWEFEQVAEGEFLFRNAERQVRIFMAQDKAGSTFVQSEGRAYRLSPVDRDFGAGAEQENGGKGGGRLIAAMPGRIIKVLVEPGQEVEQNQPILVMESMKMEITRTSSLRGQVEEVNIKAGQQVNAGSLMVRIEPISRE